MTKPKPIHKALFLLMLLLLSGCMDVNEVEKKAYVVALGMDKSEEDGMIDVTYLITNPEYGSQQEGGSTGEPPFEIISFTANDIIVSRNMANAVIAKDISYDLLRFIAISQELAEDNEFIRMIYDTTKDEEIRRDAEFFVTKERTVTFFENNRPKLETKPHDYFEMILRRGHQIGFIPDSKLMYFFRTTEANEDLFLAAFGTTEREERTVDNYDEDQFLAGEFHYGGQTNQTTFAGSAVFKQGKMIGTLTAQETRLTMMLNKLAEATDRIVTFPDPFNNRYRLAARLLKNKEIKLNMDLKRNEPDIHVHIPLEVEVLTDHSMANYATHRNKRDILKKEIEANIEKKVEELIHKVQKDFKGEPFGWSVQARRYFPDLSEYKKYNWHEKFPEAKVQVSVEIKFGVFGRQTELPNLKELRD